MQKHRQRYGKAKVRSMKGQGKCRNIGKGMARQRQGKRQKINDRAKENARAKARQKAKGK